MPAIVLLFVTVTQVPPQIYNFHDDFQKYFGHPVRMLETGSVFGSRLNDIGFDTLGGQAFLDGFCVALFPIQYINGVDAAFALFLGMMLASQLRNIPAALSVVVINPQYVNISALYTGSFLILAVLIEDAASAALTGLLDAGIIALKGTFLLFAGAHLAAAFFVRGFKWTLQAGFWCFLFLAPWIALHAPHYLQAFSGPGIADHGVRPEESFNLFSTTPLAYGGTPLAYTGLMVATGLCGLVIARVKQKVDMTAAACFASMALYLFIIYVSGPGDAGYVHALRYFTAIAIGVAPAAFAAAAAVLAMTRYRWVVLAVCAIPLLDFAPSFCERVQRASQAGTELVFKSLPNDPDYMAYTTGVLHGDMRQRVAAAQAKVPPGEEILAWINAPFFLDFKRNPIQDVEPGIGVTVPWAKLPSARYTIFEYCSYANIEEATYKKDAAKGPDLLRRVAAARLDLTHTMNQMMRSGEKLFDDGGISVFRN